MSEESKEVFEKIQENQKRREQEWSMLNSQVVGGEVFPEARWEQIKRLTEENKNLRDEIAAKDAMLNGLSKSVTTLALAIDPTATHGPESEKLAEYIRAKLATAESELSALSKWLDQKIAEAKEACKKATPFDFERGSDLLAYTAVRNWVMQHKKPTETETR